MLGLSLCIGSPADPSPAEAREHLLWREEEQRFRVGLKLFPACLGAVESLQEKRLPDGDLRVLVVHDGPAQTASEVVRNLKRLGEIRDFPLLVESVSAAKLDASAAGSGSVSGIFIASVGVGSQRLRAWSERYRALVFSPFAGDVERGAVAGIHVTDRILPYVNLVQAARAGVRFKPFFLQVARKHE